MLSGWSAAHWHPFSEDRVLAASCMQVQMSGFDSQRDLIKETRQNPSKPVVRHMDFEMSDTHNIAV